MNQPLSKRGKRAMRIIKLLMGLACLWAGCLWAGNTPDPMIMLNKVSTQMIATLKANQARLKQDPAYVYSLVNTVLIPHADMISISRTALGRDAWMSASAADQQAFSKEFKEVLIGTYASALNAYTDETMKFDPIRGGYEGQTELEVQSHIMRSDGPPVEVSYRISLKNQEWKLSDLNVEGVSLIQSFQSQFANMLAQGETLKVITHNLQERNQQNRAKLRAS
jgi:phospholipid transport system substrate-binding protein